MYVDKLVSHKANKKNYKEKYRILTEVVEQSF